MSAWRPDALLDGCEALELEFPDDYEGEVVATLVRASPERCARAALYVHGFVDYFFQAHMAQRFLDEGYAFYALDLRKHGRALRPHQHPCFCKSLLEYDAELSRAIEVIDAEQGNVPLLLAGHSTGGLTASLYAHRGERRGRVNALWLNSPFFEFRASPARRMLLEAAARIGRIFPLLSDPKALSPDYGRSLHRGYAGEWAFDLRLKPLEGFPAFYGWFAAIREAHLQVHRGLSIACPVLAMHSDAADTVLDARDIARWSPRLGANVTVQAFPGGLHDLVLSRSGIREDVFDALFVWLRGALN
jgi:alpha-beta hydrolase superfamily lysophospholipase